MPRPLKRADTTPLERTLALAISCPLCLAPKDAPCHSNGSKRRYPHHARVRANVPW